MTNEELLAECKKSFGMQVDSTDFDGALMPKILTAKSYMKRAGVSDTVMEDDLAVGVIVMLVTDLWNSGGGEIKFSPALNTMLSQLAFD